MAGPGSNLSKIKSEFADDPEMAELVEIFVSELPDRIRTLDTVWSGARFEELRRISHQLKGASAGYGYSSIGVAAGRLEATLKEVDGAPDADRLTAIKAQFDELITLCRRAAA